MADYWHGSAFRSGVRRPHRELAAAGTAGRASLLDLRERDPPPLLQLLDCPMLPKPPAASCDWVCCDWSGFCGGGLRRRIVPPAWDACLGCLGGGGWQDGSMDSLPAHDLVWTGSYTADSGGRGTGIGAVAA